MRKEREAGPRIIVSVKCCRH